MEGDHFSVMGSDGLSSVTLEKQACSLHDSINPLVIYPLFSLIFELGVQQLSHSSVTIRGTTVRDVFDHRQKPCIVSL